MTKNKLWLTQEIYDYCKEIQEYCRDIGTRDKLPSKRSHFHGIIGYAGETTFVDYYLKPRPTIENDNFDMKYDNMIIEIKTISYIGYEPFLKLTFEDLEKPATHFVLLQYHNKPNDSYLGYFLCLGIISKRKFLERFTMENFGYDPMFTVPSSLLIKFSDLKKISDKYNKLRDSENLDVWDF